ncbi:MAG TPA: hypothetical protein DCO77_08010 [Nitrospiraceae bacterium]|nr:hypothetical protein [Nitrospiraceae bacterium]
MNSAFFSSVLATVYHVQAKMKRTIRLAEPDKYEKAFPSTFRLYSQGNFATVRHIQHVSGETPRFR